MESIRKFLNQIKKEICQELSFEEISKDMYKIDTPFLYNDGDHYTFLFFVDPKQNKWVFTDNGDTFMHISYYMDLESLERDTRKEIIDQYTLMFNVKIYDEVIISVVEEKAYGEAFFNLVQCISHISDIEYLTIERAFSTFKQDFKASLEKFFKKYEMQKDVIFNYHFPEDKDKNFSFDCMFRLQDKIHVVFGINSNNACYEAIISTQWAINEKIDFEVLAIYADQANVTKKNIIRFSDLSTKTISSLENFDKFENYLIPKIRS
jgi:hypothetical protein